jgi:hypothetical protein
MGGKKERKKYMNARLISSILQTLTQLPKYVRDPR